MSDAGEERRKGEERGEQTRTEKWRTGNKQLMDERRGKERNVDK